MKNDVFTSLFQAGFFLLLFWKGRKALSVREKGDFMCDVKPDYLVRVVKDIGGKDKWTDVGVAYKNSRGSITVYLSALPLNDKILLISTKLEG